MTAAAENEALTRVGPGTPMGELLRRYWWPVGIAEDLQRKPTFVRLLGEDLVLYRDWGGRPGVLAALCSHRRANLCFGTVGHDGLRCRYPGWCYDTEGRVLDTPGEPRASRQPLQGDAAASGLPGAGAGRADLHLPGAAARAAAAAF